MIKQTKSIAISGLSLIELMIAIAIVGVVASIAVPSYLNQVQKSRRTDAQEYLTRVLMAQENHYISERPASYTTTINELPNSFSPLTPKEHYRIELSKCSGKELSECVKISANANAAGTTGKQANDKQGSQDCSVLSITSNGTKTPVECW